MIHKTKTMNKLEFQKKSLMNFAVLFGLFLSLSSAGILLIDTHFFHWFGEPIKSFFLFFSIGSGCTGLIWGVLFYHIPLPKPKQNEFPPHQYTEHMGDHIKSSVEDQNNSQSR